MAVCELREMSGLACPSRSLSSSRFVVRILELQVSCRESVLGAGGDGFESGAVDTGQQEPLTSSGGQQ